MSRTIRRKNSYDKSWFQFKDDDAYENGVLKDNGRLRKIETPLTLRQGNTLINAWFHSCGGPVLNWTPGRGYRQAYRAVSKQQLRDQMKNNDYDEIAIDKHCNDWSWW